MRLASGVRTVRPTIWAIRSVSSTLRSDTMTSARGQSQPVVIADFAKITRTWVSPAMSSGEQWLIFHPETSSAACSAKVCTIWSSASPGMEARSAVRVAESTDLEGVSPSWTIIAGFTSISPVRAA